MTSTPIVTAIMEQTVTFYLTLHILGLRAGSRLIQIIIKFMIYDERQKQQVAFWRLCWQFPAVGVGDYFQREEPQFLFSKNQIRER